MLLSPPPAPQTSGLPALLLTLLLGGLLLLSSDSRAAGTAAPPIQAIEQGWSYHWGDIPHAGAWQFTDAPWQPLARLDQLPARNEQRLLWLRLELPAGPWRDPHLFISAVDLTLQVFENDRLSYQFGEFDSEGNSHFAGWPWHLIPVHNTERPTTLYLRIYSDYYNYIGPAGTVAIGDKASQLEQIYRRGTVGLAVILAIFISGALVTCLGLIKGEHRIALCTGLLSLDLVLMMFAESELSQLLYFDPLLWRQLAAYSYFLVPLLLAAVVRAWFGPARMPIAAAVLWLAGAFVSGVVLLATTINFNVVYAYPVFDVLFVVFTLALLLGCFYRFRQLDTEDGLVVFGILALFVALLVDMLSAHEIISWMARTGQWGLAFFTLSMLVVYLRKDIQQQASLNRLMHHLEQEVAERTRELTASHRQLEQVAREDFLTGLLNRRAFMQQGHTALATAIRHHQPFSLLLLDIDHFKDINDTYSHAAGDEVLKALARICSEQCREGDLVCRYGGEEFVLLLPLTGSPEIQSFVARLQSAIQSLQVSLDSGRIIQVTASIGVVVSKRHRHPDLPADADAELLLEFVLNQADQAMYEVKSSGRNGYGVRVL